MIISTLIKEFSLMRTLADQLTKALSKPVVQKAAVTVKRLSLPDKRSFSSAVLFCNANSLDRVRYLCEAARDKKTYAAVQNAQKALLELIGKTTKPGVRQLTRAEFVLMSDWFYGLTLAGTVCDACWLDAGSVYDHCLELHKADNWRNLTQRWC